MTAMQTHGWIKVCGITSADDARMAQQAGADAIGINLWPHSPRYVALEDALPIADAVRGKCAIVTVTVDMSRDALREVAKALRPDFLQLHGNESDEDVTALGPAAFKALGLRGGSDVARALGVPGDWVLVDAKDEVRHGGTGRAPPEALARTVCAARRTILAGGLGPANVARAIEALQPAGVDATSALETDPRHKNPDHVLRYVQEARRAFAAPRRPDV